MVLLHLLHESPLIVQVFERRCDRTLLTFVRPAFEKRQCTKSRREVVRGQCRGRYGDLAVA